MTAALRARAGRRATAAPAAHPARDIRPQRLHCFFSAMVGPSQRGSCGGTPFNGGPEVRDCHFPDGRRYRRDRLLHLRLSNRADTADAEGFNLRELAGIQREAPLLGTHIRLPLIVKVERERMTVPFARFQRALAHDGETHSRNTLQTLS